MNLIWYHEVGWNCGPTFNNIRFRMTAVGAKRTFDKLAMPDRCQKATPALWDYASNDEIELLTVSTTEHGPYSTFTSSPLIAARLTASTTLRVSSPSRPETSGFSSQRITLRNCCICRRVGSVSGAT